MLTPTRQTKLDPILVSLNHPAIKQVWQDDFDSTAINVFLQLKPKRIGATFTSGRAVFQWVSHLRSIKSHIAKVLKEAGVGFNFLDWPAKKYEYHNGQMCDMGYDGEHIKIEVFV